MKQQNLILKYLLFVLYLLGGCSEPKAQHYIQTDSIEDLQDFFTWSEDRIPIVSAHRGGPQPNFPENCIETFQNTLNITPAIVECDVIQSKDGELVMMHDDSLNRTSTGNGLVKNYVLEELKTFQLLDNEGTLTDFQIPTLKEVLKWAKGKTILTLDIKRGVSKEKVVEVIREYEAESYALIITYRLEDALEYHQLNPNLMFSVSIFDFEDWDAVQNSGLPLNQIVAYTGSREIDEELFQTLHQNGVYCIYGCWKIDDEVAEKGTVVYENAIQQGADILATDLLIEPQSAVKNLTPSESSKAKYFVE